MTLQIASHVIDEHVPTSKDCDLARSDMTLSVPPNSDDAAFIAFVMVDELVDLLMSKGAISTSDVGYFYGEVAERMRQEEGPASKRASQLISDWIQRNPQIE
jgi:hypothetical protein